MNYFDGKTVLVTGGTGFVGTNFVKELSNFNLKIIVPIHKRELSFKSKKIHTINADLTNIDDCLKVCQNVDYIFHAAGMVSAARMTVNNPMTAISTNLIVTLRILEAAMKQNVKKILLFSSGTTGYPKYNHAVSEEEMFNDDPAEIYYGYGWSRRYTELLGNFASKKSNLKVAICRPTGVYGSYDDFDPSTSHVIPALIKRAIDKENPYVVWGDGEEIRDFLHVRDLVRGCFLLLEKNANSDPVNIGSGKEYKIKDIVKTILNLTNNKDVNIEFDNTKPTTIPVRKVNVDKAKKLLGFEMKISLEDGLKETIDWYKTKIK
jgi:GDP-L-fucose synthase